jgi:hypothetical protein
VWLWWAWERGQGGRTEPEDRRFGGSAARRARSERSKRRREEGARSEYSWKNGFKGVDECFLGKERHEMTCSDDREKEESSEAVAGFWG